MNYHYNLKSFFEEVVKEFTDHPSIITSEKNYSYQELNQKANKLASFMKSKNLSQGSIIAIISTKSFEDYALMIACLKLGVTYTNIDIDNPKDRIINIFKTCSPKFVFCSIDNQNIIDICNEFQINYQNYSELEQQKNLNEIAILNHDIDGDTVAYIMFTSGSTGIPKGAAITHQNLIHFIHWTSTRYSISSKDNFANISPMYFDNSVFDFYSALFNGASLTPIEKNLLTKPLDLINYITEKKCTIWFSVPSMLIYMLTMKVLRKGSLPDIRVFTFGGEGFPKTELKKLYDLYHESAELINVYGPTECTCICSSYTITESDFENLDELPSLGPINPNFSYLILEDGKKSKIGELCLLGPNVSKGYYNDPDRTKKAFCYYTDENHYEKPMYKTGDLVEEKNSLLYFKGRVDNQIKHMGYRIELEEIEIALNGLDSIKQSAVLYKRVNTSFGKIFAFIVGEREELDFNEIKQELKDKIPTYMIPGSFQQLEKFPKNANGKLDKKALQEMLATS